MDEVTGVFWSVLPIVVGFLLGYAARKFANRRRDPVVTKSDGVVFLDYGGHTYDRPWTREEVAEGYAEMKRKRGAS